MRFASVARGIMHIAKSFYSFILCCFILLIPCNILALLLMLSPSLDVAQIQGH